MSSTSHIDQLLAEAGSALKSAATVSEVGEINIRYLGRKGKLPEILKSLKELPADQRKSVGAAANKAKGKLGALVAERLGQLDESPVSNLDYTLPGQSNRIGRPHVLSATMAEMTAVFTRMGFATATGPEVETDQYNFGSLNFPEDHPARDMQDTFYLRQCDGLPAGLLLRTHTSNVQIREFEKRTPPLKIIAPGKVFRHEAVSTRAYCVFHQIEGFQVGENVTLGDLKGVLLAFCREFFSTDVKLRFRPSFFPFTEPSAEVDMSCLLCDGAGCLLCKYDGWLEILGCGMIDPNVMQAVGYDPEKLSGYAFGMGVERVTMLKRRITDIRLFYENDLRFLRQF
ncbi:MAG: phenylalanine--tRNA ligase subunit alpha [candidate division Zixibacteria bacterium]|nr:phenylalanine--tRNA ligase subunit alpha [candidate division Zixibacteria bacterium]